MIRDKRPTDEDDLLDSDPKASADEAGSQLSATVQGETTKVEANYASLNTTPPPVPAVPGAPLPPQPGALATAAVNARAAVPDAVPGGDVSLTKDSDAAKQQIDGAGMNKPAAALVQSGPIAEAREAEGELTQVAKEDPAIVLARQKETLAKANGDMAALQSQALAALVASRASTVGKTETRQQAMVGTEEQMREQAGTEAEKVLKKAQDEVRDKLKPLVPTALAQWEAAKNGLTIKFRDHLAEVKSWVEERHSGIGGGLLAIGDYFTGLPGWVKREYDEAETDFSDGVIAELTTISTGVEAVIKACEGIIANARKEKDRIFNALPDSLKGWAAQEKLKFDKQFDSLGQEVQAERTAFVKNISESASQAVNEVRAEIAELRKKAGGLVGKIADAVRRFLNDPAKFIIEGLLGLLGISPPAFWAVVAKIKKFIDDIVDDPLGFAGNLLSGIGQGFSLFFDNFPAHMVRGFLTWLLGDLKDVEIPKELSLKGIITFFLQVMGITWPNIRKLLAERVGEKNIALIERVWSLVSMFIDQGPQGIYEMVKDKLNPQAIIDQVIDMAVDFMMTAIMKNVAARLLLLFNPVGAILQAIEAIYRVLKWVFQNAARIFTLIETIVNGLADIIAGNVGGFAKTVEKGLAMLIAPVLGFLADYFNLGDLPKMVAKQIKSLRTWILKKIGEGFDWVITKGKALLAAVGLGGKEKKGEQKKDGGYDGQIGKVVHWTAEEETHELWIAETGDTVEVMMASEDKGPVRGKLTKYEKQVAALKGPGSVGRKQRANDAIAAARTILAETLAKALEARLALANAHAKPGEIKAKDDQTESWEEALWPQLQIIQIALKLIPLPPSQVKGSGAMASKVTAEPLSSIGSGGGKPDDDVVGWDHVKTFDKAQQNYWVKGHLVNHWFHGPGKRFNLVPLRQVDNSDMRDDIEFKAYWNHIDKDDVIYYSARVSYHTAPSPSGFPSSIDIEWGTMRYHDKEWKRADALKPYNIQPKPPPLAGDNVANISDSGETTLDRLGVPIGFARQMRAERKSGGPFSELDFARRMKAAYPVQSGIVDGDCARGLERVDDLIKSKKLEW